MKSIKEKAAEYRKACGNLTVYSFKFGWIKYYIDLFWSKEQKGEKV